MTIAQRLTRKRLMLICVNLIVFFALISPTYSQKIVDNSQSRKVINTIIKRMVDSEKTVKSLTSNLTMIQYDHYLNISDTMTGTFVYLPKSKSHKVYARIDWSKPEEQISVIGDEFELYRPRLKQVIFGKIKKISARNPLELMNMSKDMLDKNYSVMYLGRTKTISGLKMSSLRVTPAADKNYRWTEFWIDKSGGLRQIKLIENNGDTNTILLSNIKKNVKVKGSIFKLSYPKSAIRIKA